jgi:hypothetical protein
MATRGAVMILDYVRENALTVEWIPDTHPHTGHFVLRPLSALVVVLSERCRCRSDA